MPAGTNRTALLRRSMRLVAVVCVLVMVAVMSACGGASSPTTTSAAPSVDATTDTTSPPASGEGGFVTVDVQTAFEALTDDGDAQLVDVREPAEWEETGVAAGAHLIPLGELEQRAPDELAKDRPVYVICRSGNRSRIGAATLVGLGFSRVYDVDGGVSAWSAAGLPLEPFVP